MDLKTQIKEHSIFDAYEVLTQMCDKKAIGNWKDVEDDKSEHT